MSVTPLHTGPAASSERAPSRSSRSAPGRGGAVLSHISLRQTRHGLERSAQPRPVCLIAGHAFENAHRPVHISFAEDLCSEDVCGRLHLDRVHSLSPLRNEVSHDGVCQDADLHRLPDPSVIPMIHGRHWTARPFLVDARSAFLHRKFSVSPSSMFAREHEVDGYGIH